MKEPYRTDILVATPALRAVEGGWSGEEVVGKSGHSSPTLWFARHDLQSWAVRSHSFSLSRELDSHTNLFVIVDSSEDRRS